MSASIAKSERRPRITPRFAAFDGLATSHQGTMAVLRPARRITATPYRLDSGMLHEGKGALFTDIAFEVSGRQLIDDGWLCPLVSKAAETRLDVSGVGSRGGEFIPGQLQAAVDLPEITEAAIDEVVRLGADRKSWLVFCDGVEHATHVAEAIRVRGFSAATIFGDTPKSQRDRRSPPSSAGRSGRSPRWGC